MISRSARIDGTFAALPRTHRWPRLRPPTVTFVPLVDSASLAGDGDGTIDDVRIVNALRDRGAMLGKPMPAIGNFDA
jgi:hypothetical protein